MREPIQVLIYPVKLAGEDWQYLLLRRASNRGGFWQGVTGAVEEGESLVEAARRELFEETGLIPSIIEGLDYSYSFSVEDEWRHHYADEVEEITEHVFVAYVNGEKEPIIDPEEHNAWRWCFYDEALELLTWPENVEALKQCHRFLSLTKRSF